MKTYSFDNQNDLLRWHDLLSGSTPLIYLHGLGCASSSDYPRVVTSTQYTDVRTWLVDLPGAGFSDKPDIDIYDSSRQADILHGWIGNTAPGPCHVFGHSAGAFIAIKLAQRMSASIEHLILCQPGLSDYGMSMLEQITSMSEAEFIRTGFDQLMARLKEDPGNDAWLGPFQVCSPKAIYQWAGSSLTDNADGAWIDALAALPLANKGVILSDTATQDEIDRYQRAGCRVEIVANSGHMMAYDNPDGLAAAIATLLA